MYPSVLNSFPVIRTTSAKNCRFHVPQPTFLFLLETPLQLSRNMLHGRKDNSMLVKPLAAYTHLSSTVFQLFEPQVQKITVFTYRSPHFCFPWRRRHPCDYHAICCMDGKTIQYLSNPSQNVPICLQQFPSYSNCKCKKIAVFTYRSPHFCFPWRWRHPFDYHAICCMDGKTIQCLSNCRVLSLSDCKYSLNPLSQT